MEGSSDIEQSEAGLDEVTEQNTMQMVVDEEIELEIGMRSNLLEVLESRIGWAEQMLATLKSSTKDVSITQYQYEHAAIDALAAAETPCQYIFPKSRLYSPVMVSDILRDPLPTRNTRPRAHGRTRGATPAATKLLYIKYTYPDSSLTTIISKLRCTNCQRTDFPTLQGLMNHCRMAHHKSYNTHEDCVSACAVLVEDEDEREWIMTNGTEIAAGPEVSRPSLQRLFARAAGEKSHPPPTPSAALANTTSSGISTVKNEPQDKEMTLHEHHSSTHIMNENSTTPGHYQNSRALAKFLGKESRRRGIGTVDEVEAINIGHAVENHTNNVGPKWRMRYSVRSGANRSSPGDTRSAVDDTDTPDAMLLETHSPGYISPKLESPESRFHIIARIVITDKSRWIPPASRFNAHTHQWMITVTSPSYVRATATIISRILVKCISDDVSPVFAEDTTNVANGPPFYVRGTTDRPFLAEVEIHWASSSSDTQQFQANPPIKVEQWVDIGPEKYTSPVIGEDQTLDVELDRNTIFFRDRCENREFTWKEDAKSTPVAPSKDAEEDPPHVQRLKSLLSRFPMVLKDVKTRFVPKVAYTMVPTAAHLLALTYGRRKAIEFGLSRALCTAYNEGIDSDGDNSSNKMRPADVFRWLEGCGHFHRPPPAHEARHMEDPSPITLYCPRCGLDKRHHTSTQPFEQCNVSAFPWPVDPRLDIAKFLGLSGQSIRIPYNLHPTLSGPSSRPSSITGGLLTDTQLILSAVDPRLIRSMLAKDDVEAPASLDNSTSPHDGGSRNAAQAIIVIAMKIFLSRLLNGAVSCIRQEQATSSNRPHWSRAKTESRLITPYHVWQGLTQGSTSEIDGAAALVAMSILGSTAT